MDDIERASILLGKKSSGYIDKNKSATNSTNVSMITGEAMTDSSDGTVTVNLYGYTISDDDEQYVDIPTTVSVKAGDTVQISLIGADGTAKSMIVTGVIAGGDRMRADIETAKDTSAAADAAAAVAKENASAAQTAANNAKNAADTAQSTANTTKTYFYNDSSGSHVRNQNSTSAGTRTDVKADGLHVIDQDDGKELASFTSGGASIGKDSKTHSKYTSDGVHFYEKNKSYPFTRIYPVSIEKEKYSAASISSSPSDITDAAVMDDGFWHSSGAVSTSAVDGTSTDNNGWARAALVASTVQSNNSNSASVEVFASNSNPNKGSGGVGGADNYINMTADEVYINNRAIPKIVSGTKVFHVVNTNFADLFTYDEIKQILNINSIDATKICIFVQNGDADASTIKLGNVEYRPSDNKWYVTFLESGDFYYRVNYVIVYNPEIKEG